MKTYVDRVIMFCMCVVALIFSTIDSASEYVFGSKQPVIVQPEPVVDPQPEPKPEPEPERESKDGTIVMYTSDGCIWCTRWKANELPKIQKANWKYEEVYVTEGPVPRFDIHGNKKVVKHTGYLDMPTLRKIVEGMK